MQVADTVAEQMSVDAGKLHSDKAKEQYVRLLVIDIFFFFLNFHLPFPSV